VADAFDACPDESAGENVAEGARGCPAKRALARIGEGKLDLRANVVFATGSANIDTASHPLLDEVVALLQGRPDITLVRIEGHTDNEGKPERNNRLSRRRARSVLAYLVDHGVAASRLVSEGFGDSRPVADNATVEGRDANRRVDFIIVGVSGGAR
jgi:outer membrane protein OmpA-like peptidoglycan-associated protein